MIRHILFFCILWGNIFPASGREARRIVSLAASVTKNIYLLGGEDRLAGCTRFCETAPADSIPVVGDAVNINLEKIALLRPDLVIAGGLTHPNTLKALEKLGIRTVRLFQPADFEEVCAQLLQLGYFTGKEEEARRINRESEARLRKVAASVPAGKRPKVFFQIGRDPLFTALPDTFMHDYIVRAGGENIAGDLTNGMVSREFVLLRNPDVILITAMGEGTADEARGWQNIQSLSAVKNKQIHLFGDEICSPTPVVFAETVEKIAAILQTVRH